MSPLPSGLPEVVADEEELVRFLRFSGQFSSAGAKPAAFLPSPKDGETSVFRHAAEEPERLWRLAADHLPGVQIHGAAVVTAANVRRASIDVLPSEPPPRHAAIVNWPINDDPDEQKAQQKLRALQLCQASRLLRP